MSLQEILREFYTEVILVGKEDGTFQKCLYVDFNREPEEEIATGAEAEMNYFQKESLLNLKKSRYPQ